MKSEKFNCVYKKMYDKIEMPKGKRKKLRRTL